MNEIAVLSGKGGTGKSSLTAAFATLQERMLVADCDVDAANLPIILQPANYREEIFISGKKAVIDYSKCSNCGLCATYCRFDAIKTTDNNVQILEASCDGCRLCERVCPSGAISMIENDKSRWFAGTYRNGYIVHARLAPGEDNSGKLVNVVREQAKKIATDIGLDKILIDGPPGTGCPVISTVTGIKTAILVTEPTRSGFHDLQRILELIQGFRVKPLVVINKYDLNPEMADRIETWCENSSIDMVGKIPFDPEIVDAMVNCQSIIEWNPYSETSKTIKSIWKEIITRI